MNRYSPNLGVNETIEALLALGCPPIPVAPLQDPRREWCYRVVKTKDGVKYCPLDKNLDPIPRFSGKNPSYLKRDGSPWICQHGEFQNRLPTEKELREFFCHPDTGVGTLGGHAGLDWLDFDKKHYDSQQDCDRDVERIISENNLQGTWIERTGSDGWRIAVKPFQKPTFTNFATSADGEHVGEALFEGRFTVLAPTIHPNGKPYRRVGWGEPVEVESLQAIGIYPSKDEVEQAERNQKREQHKASNPHYGQPSNPQNNPWDIRNFAHYFESYHERSDGWAAAKCPNHNGTSPTSFRVCLDTGYYKLWCGCNTKDVYRSGLALAVASGYNLPLSNGEPEQTQPQQESDWKQRAKAAWRKNRRFTNAIKSCTKWVNWEKPPANSIFFGKAGLGRGKTTNLIGWVNEWKAQDLSFLCFGYRNSLLLQLCSDKKDEQGKPKGLGFYHLHEHSGMMMKSASGEGLALCVDSLWRFSPEDFDDKIIILDEVQSVIKHLLHSSTVRNRDKIIGLFFEAIKRSRQVICLDGLMADWCVDYLHGICPEKQIIKAENTYQGKKPVVNYLLGTVVEGEEKGKIKVNDRSPWFKYLMENSCIPVVCSDSQALIEALDNIFTERGLKVLRIDSKTVPELYIKECLEDCNAYIKKERPDVLLYTPSAESGVDVSIPDYFTEHFAFFFGVLDIDAMLQMLGRIRDSITKYVWCKSFVSSDEKQHSKSPFATAIQESLNQLILGDISTSITNPEAWNQKVIQHLTAVVTQSNNIDTRVSTLIQSIQNFEKSNLRECLKEALIESGYTVKDCILESSNHGKKAKEETEAVKRRNASDIFKAQKIPIETLKELSFDAKWEDRCEVMQAHLRERLPSIEQTDVWTEDFIYLTKYGDRNFISHQEMFWLFNHPEIAKQQSQKHFHWMARRLNTFIGNYKSRWAKLNALYQIGLPEFLDSADEWTDDSSELVALVERAKQHTNALGCHPGSQSNIRFLGGLLGMLGLKLKSRKVGKETRCYHINRDVINDPVRLQVLTCIETKFLETRTENLTQSDWDTAINEAHGILPTDATQTQPEQGLQVETRTPQIVYRNEGVRVSKNLGLESCVVGGVVEAAVVQKSEVEQLVDALPFAETAEDFATIVEGSPLKTVEDAIALQDTQPRRLQLQAWLETLNQPVGEVEPQPLKVRSWQWSELPLVKSVLRWIDRTEQVRVLAVDADGFCQVRSLLSGLTTNTHVSQLSPVSG